MMPSKLDKSLLYRIMERVGELREAFPSTADTTDLLDLVGKERGSRNEPELTWYLDRHLEFLSDCEFVVLGAPTADVGIRTIELTGKGQMFVQPELAEFGTESMLPAVIRSLEGRLQALSFPQEEKDGLMYRMRDAVAKQAPDLIAKVIAEMCSKIISGH